MSFLVQLQHHLFLLKRVTLLRLESACSSSSSCRAVSLAWAERPTAQLYDSSNPRLLGWPLRLGKTLPLWNSKDKKCCLYKTPYVAAPLREIGDTIVRTLFCVRLPTEAPTGIRFFWFTSEVFLKRNVLSTQDSYVLYIQGSPLAQAVPRKDYFTHLRSPVKSTSSVSAGILRFDMMSWVQTSRNLLKRIL